MRRTIFYPVLMGLLAAMVALSLLAVFASPAHGDPVTDYDGYPANAGVLDGCTVGGLGEVVFTNATLSEGGIPHVRSKLRQLTVRPGDTIRMDWGAPRDAACVGSTVSLSVKRAFSPQYDMHTDQETVLWAEAVVGPEPGVLTLPVEPTVQHSQEGLIALTCYQLDAALGSPLQVVGPNGAYYGANGTLISAKNGNFAASVDDCAPTQPQDDDEQPRVLTCDDLTQEEAQAILDNPTESWQEQLFLLDPEGDGVACGAPTTVPDTTVLTVPAPDTTAPSTTVLEAEELAVGGECVYDAGVDRHRNTATGEFCALRQLPATGSGSGNLVPAGGLMLGLGAVAVLATRRRRTVTA